MLNTKMIMPLIVGFYVTFAIAAMSITPIVAAEESDDIPTNAQATGVHDSLYAALLHADLVTTLEGDGPFTVFAPTDEAFAAAGIDLATFDTDEENATLADILGLGPVLCRDRRHDRHDAERQGRDIHRLRRHCKDRRGDSDSGRCCGL